MDKKPSTTFFNEAGRLWSDNPDSLTAFQGKTQSWAKIYFSQMVLCIIEIDELQQEIELILSKIEHQKIGMLTKLLPVEELILNIKFYFIAWSTMKDVMAKLISEVFDLGIADIDINFGSLLRNKKVKQTRIPAICKKYNKALDISGTDKARNEATHRGKLLDADVIELKNKKRKIESKKYSLLQNETDKISDAEYKTQMSEYYSELKILVKQKQEQYRTHFSKTIEFNAEIIIELATVYHKNLNGHRT